MNHGGDPLNWVRLAALGIIWGGSFMLVEIALRDVGPFTLVAARIAMAALMLWALCYPLCGGLPRRGIVWAFALGSAILSNALPFALLTWAQTYLPSSVTGVFMATMPFIALAMSHFLVAGERMTGRNLAGLAIGFAGMLVLFGADALRQLASGEGTALAQIACLTAAVCYASGSVVMKRAPKTRPVAFGAATMILAALLSTGVALWTEGPPRAMPSVTSAVALVALAVGPTAGALLLMLRILEGAGPPFLSLVNYQVPVWAVIFGAVFLGEAVSPRLGIALALILAGLAVSQGMIPGLWRRARGRGA